MFFLSIDCLLYSLRLHISIFIDVNEMKVILVLMNVLMKEDFSLSSYQTFIIVSVR